MKQAVSVSLGSSVRNKVVEVELLGETIRLERIGTDGDMARAAEIFADLDGQIEAFGLGGADLGLLIDGQWYPLYSIQPLVRHVRRTPVVDGTGLKNTLESQLAQTIESRLGDQIQPKRVFITLGSDRWGMSTSFENAGYECIFGDLMFGLGLPFPVRSTRTAKRLARIVMPIAGRLPYTWLYPTGEAQETRAPKWTSYYDWASVIAGDCHYIKRHMPDRLDGKVIATNTTTPEDFELFRQAGVSHLVTSTPRLEGRSFGTNMMEAALVAVAGKGRPLSVEELREMLRELKLEPEVHSLV